MNLGGRERISFVLMESPINVAIEQCGIVGVKWTKTLLFSYFFFGLFVTTTGQTDNLILTNKQNDEWVDSLSKLTLDKKLTMLNERILNDTNVFVRQSYPDRIKAVEKPSNRVYGDGKPTIIVNQNAVIIDNKTPNSKVVALTQLLNTKNIADIKILKGTEQETLAVYGSNGRSGIILMTLANKEIITKFKKLKLTSSY